MGYRTILTYKNGDELYTPVSSLELPENAVAFKYLEDSTDEVLANYKIGIPINKPKLLTEEEKKFDLENDGNGEFALYDDGENRRIIPVEPGAMLVDNYEQLSTAYSNVVNSISKGQR